jgi:large subunit ribosomal protein L17
MRHGNKLNHLGRKSAHRKAMISNMACSLIEHKRITTTVAKAKALRVFVEPLLTKSKTDSTHSRRVVFSYLQNKDIVSELFREVAPKIADRNGGYTRIIRTGFRLGDNAETCMIELVDFNTLYTKEETKKSTRRSRRGGGAKANPAVESNAESIEEAVVVDSTEETTASAVEEVPAAEETAVVEEALAAEEAAVVEEAPAAEETAVVEETLAAEEAEVVEEAPAAEETADVVETPAAEETAAVEEAPVAEESTQAENSEANDETPEASEEDPSKEA